MKNIFIMFVLLATAFGTTAQSISRSAVGTAGGTLTGGSSQLTFSIGDPVTSTLSAPGNTLTQGFQQPGEQIKTGTIPLTICSGTNITVPYSAIDIGGGNTFTAQLSDAGGSFANPVAIGTVAGNASGNITATIPANTTGGSNYRIRVISSSPGTNGTDSGTDIAISDGLAPAVSGLVNVCAYVGTGTPISYNFNAAGATGYTYILPPNVSLVSSTANSITLNFLNGFAAQANKQIRVKAISACGTSVQTIYQLAAQSPGTPKPIVAANSNICSVLGNGGTITYTIESVSGASSYNWTNPAGTTILHPNGTDNPNDTTITLSFDGSFSGGNLTVSANSGGCGAGGTRSLTISRANPSTPGLITGPTNACAYMSPNGVVATYSVAPVANAVSYTWTVPSGATGLTGQGTNSISFTYPSGFSTGNVSVTATNGCGTSGVRSVAVSKLNPATPSVMDVIQTQFCPNRVYTYTLTSMPANATSVQWTVPATAISFTGQGSSSIAVTYPPTAVNGNVTAQAINNCASSTIRTSVVKLPACPTTFAKENTQGRNSTKQALAENATTGNKITVVPNPSSSSFKLSISSMQKQAINVTLLDASGRKIKTMNVQANQSIDFGSELRAGVYLLEIEEGGTRRVERIIKL